MITPPRKSFVFTLTSILGFAMGVFAINLVTGRDPSWYELVNYTFATAFEGGWAVGIYTVTALLSLLSAYAIYREIDKHGTLKSLFIALPVAVTVNLLISVLFIGGIATMIWIEWVLTLKLVAATFAGSVVSGFIGYEIGAAWEKWDRSYNGHFALSP